MASILFKAIDANNPDPLVDRQGCYKYGDAVCVLETDHRYGSAETIPTFLQVVCHDVERAEIEHLLEPLTEQTAAVDEQPPTVTLKRYGFDFTLLPAEFKHQLFGTGRVEIPYYILQQARIAKVS